jgi:hypothetical protein
MTYEKSPNIRGFFIINGINYYWPPRLTPRPLHWRLSSLEGILSDRVIRVSPLTLSLVRSLFLWSFHEWVFLLSCALSLWSSFPSCSWRFSLLHSRFPLFSCFAALSIAWAFLTPVRNFSFATFTASSRRVPLRDRAAWYAAFFSVTSRTSSVRYASWAMIGSICTPVPDLGPQFTPVPVVPVPVVHVPVTPVPVVPVPVTHVPVVHVPVLPVPVVTVPVVPVPILPVPVVSANMAGTAMTDVIRAISI